MNHGIPRLLKFLGACFFQLLLLLSATGAITRNSPGMPTAGLDPSWVLGLNQAMAQGLAFGKDIIWTCGPYASLYTKMYHPAIDTLFFASSLFLAIAYWLCFAAMIRGEPWRWHVALAFSICIFLLHDAVLLCYPLILCICIHKIAINPINRKSQKIVISGIITIIFASLGLIILVKGSILLLYCITVSLCCLFFIYKKEYYFSSLAACSFLASIVIFWMIAHQQLSSLIYYFLAMSSIVSGYSDAMSANGPSNQIIIYIITYIIILYIFYRYTNIHTYDKLFIIAILIFTGFSAFKSGFVRHDAHALNASGTLAFIVSMLAIVFRSKNFSIAILSCAVAWICIDGAYRSTSSSSILNYASSLYSTQQPQRFLQWFAQRSTRKMNFDAALQSIQKKKTLPFLAGTSDIYSYDQAELIASGNAWAPRPVFQSHGAYTPALALANRGHLMSAAAPDNIFFQVQPIDNRLPSLEDGASWPVLLAGYRFDHMVAKDMALLRKKGQAPSPVAAGTDAAPQEWKTRSLGEAVSVPGSERPLFASIRIKPTLWGRLATFFFKPAHLELRLRLAGGGEKRFRFVAGMGETGFLLSPLVETTEEFTLLYADDMRPLTAKAVASFTLPNSGGGGKLLKYMAKLQWPNHKSIAFSDAAAYPAGSAQLPYAAQLVQH
jgi:hypothetical protein